MAGLSLAFYLNESVLRNKKILIIDREIKSANDHTWSFWEPGKSAFEEAVFRKWNGFWFHGTNGFSEFLHLENYLYKTIRAEDFYRFIKQKLAQNSNFTFIQAAVSEIFSNQTETIVKTENGEFFATKFVFDSTTHKSYDNAKYQNLWQHFKGWTIKTDKKFFNPNEPTLFDFRIEQKNECRFIYVLPHSENTALIEFTIFSDNFLEQSEYDFYLQKYVAEVLKIETFEVMETEFGIIPMSDEPHEQIPAPRIVRIGTAGGYVKSSTGYSFQRTQRFLQKLVENLIASDSEFDAFVSMHKVFSKKRYLPTWKSYLDAVLLDVLRTKKHSADSVFTHLFRGNKTEQVLKFLDEDTNLIEDFKIMRSVPIVPFTKAALEISIKRV